MSDMFGQEPSHYTIVQDLQRAELWNAHQAGHLNRLRVPTSPVHDFDALGHGAPNEILARATDQQQAAGYLTNNLLALQTQVDEMLYTRFRLPMYLAFDETVPEGALTRGVRFRDRRGRAARISAPGYEAPSATAGQSLISQEMYWYGLDAEWAVDELRGAMFGGFALDNESIEAAIMGTMEEMEAVGLTGGGYEDATGLLNHPITGANAVHHVMADTTFADTNGVGIRSLINTHLSATIERTQETIGRNIDAGMTVFLPGPQFDLLNSLYIGDNAERTLMMSIIEDNPWTHFTRGNVLNIERVLELNGITSSGQDRMVIGLRNPRVVNMGVSIQPRVLGVVDKGRVICAQIEAKFSETWFLRPNVYTYVDGI